MWKAAETLRALTDYQWLVLWEIEDRPSAVWFRQEILAPDVFATRQWFIELGGKSVKITHQIWALISRGLVAESAQGSSDVVYVTPQGLAALERRDYMAVMDRHNSRV